MTSTIRTRIRSFPAVSPQIAATLERPAEAFSVEVTEELRPAWDVYGEMRAGGPDRRRPVWVEIARSEPRINA